MAHIRQPRPDTDLSFQVQVQKSVNKSPLRSKAEIQLGLRAGVTLLRFDWVDTRVATPTLDPGPWTLDPDPEP